MDHCAYLRSRLCGHIYLAIVAIALVLSTSGQVLAQGGISYVYDELGRLVAVVDPAGDTVRYNYDAVGNVLSISRQSSSILSIINFNPTSGPVGTSVTIYGTSFSSTPSQNTVTFNGMTATVVSATATKIVTAVPTGATTGPITVTTPTGSATSGTSFTVSSSLAPTISGFTPTIGESGTAVTITGTNFETTASNNGVVLNVSHTLVGSATATSISTTVPPLTGSGRISVATPNGKAVSNGDFFIPPSPYTPADVDVTGRMILGESKTVAINTANKVGMILFDAEAGQRASLKINSSTITSGWITVYSPRGAALGVTSFSGNGEFLDTPILPLSGTYIILVDPDSTYTGNLNFTLSNASDFTGTIVPGGAPVTVTTSTYGQNARLTFSGAASQRVSLNVTGVNLTGGTNNFVNVSIRKPDGTSLVWSNLAGAGFIDTQVLPVTGQYTILVDPWDTSTGSVTLTLYDVPADPTGTITPGASPVTVTTTAIGQNAQLHFSGSVNQRVTLLISGVNLTGGSYNWVNVSIRKPDGTTLVSSTLAAGGFIDTQVLPVTGQYTILVDPWDTSTGSVTLTLYDVPADPTGTITPGGSPVTVTTVTPGQNAQLSFSGSVNQRVSLLISGVNLTGGTYNSFNVFIRKPDGATLAWTTLVGVGFIDATVLPVAGTYTILFDPSDTSTGNITLTLYDVPADAANTATVGGTAVTVSTTVPGQNAQVTFGGTSGQQITVRLSNNTMGTVTVSLLKPDRTTLTYTSSSGSSFNLAAQSLPTTGTYTIRIDPDSTNVGSISARVTDGSANLAFGQQATQSSTAWGASADRAVDGNTDGNFGNNSVTHTTVESEAWWQVDLGSVQSISTIDVWNRTDCCGDALTNFYVFVSDNPFTSTGLSATQNQSGVSGFHVSGQAGTPTSISVGRTGRYVRVQLVGTDRISLAEVQVWPAP
jgi:YD repeat-containing protein